MNEIPERVCFWINFHNKLVKKDQYFADGTVKKEVFTERFQEITEALSDFLEEPVEKEYEFEDSHDNDEPF